jgi:hypothetical protein
MAESTRDKADKARYKRADAPYDAGQIVDQYAKNAGVTLNYDEYNKATAAVTPRVKSDREKTARRAEFIADREEAKAKEARIQAATGTQPGHHVTSVDRKTGKSK